ncbi:hypothetical protein ACUH91_07840 [Dermabacteraceae bacterium P9123]
MERLVFMWDYLEFPLFVSSNIDDAYPDIRPLISPELTAALTRWGKEMCNAYGDEDGVIRPSPETAKRLDKEYDELTARLRAEGLNVEQHERWWLRPDERRWLRPSD